MVPIKMIHLSVFLYVTCGYLPIASALQIVVEEDSSAVLKCNSAEILDIQLAEYGGDSFVCRDNVVTSIVQGQCQGKQTCLVHATDDLYTDSCLGPSETLTIKYTCEVHLTTDIVIQPTIATNSSKQSRESPETEKNVHLTTDIVIQPTIATNSSKQSRESPETEKSVPIGAPIVGCIVGLVLAVLVIIAVCRKYRFRSTKQVDEHIHMTSLTGQILTNDCDESQDRTDSTARKTGHRNTNDFTYATATGELNPSRKHSVDSLPPSYDLATTGRPPSISASNTNSYNTSCQYDHTDSFKKPKLTDDANEYDLATPNTQDSGMTEKSETVYENEIVGQNGIHKESMCNPKPGESIEAICSSNANLYCHGVDNETNISGRCEYGNQYANVDLKSAKHQTDDAIKKKNKTLDQRYMAMSFTNTQEPITDDNVYVPIMSPTSSTFMAP